MNVDDSFEPLEQKVRRAAELVRHLRDENRALTDELRRARTRLKETEHELEGGSSKATGDEVGGTDALGREVKALREERAQLRARIAKLLQVLDGIE